MELNNVTAMREYAFPRFVMFDCSVSHKVQLCFFDCLCGFLQEILDKVILRQLMLSRKRTWCNCLPV